ncbi:MAG: hypothetical protein KJZ59_09530 [Pararhodobacter sp.]|nr:hypothetical protein [Pararhodobacter sp.]
MPRTALVLAAFATMSLNGSVALATMPAPARCSNPETVCVISLRMMAPPPPRPTNLGAHEPSARPLPVVLPARPQ